MMAKPLPFPLLLRVAGLALAALPCGAGCTSSSSGGHGTGDDASTADASMNVDGGADGGLSDDGAADDGDAAVRDDFVWATSFAAASGTEVLAMAADATSVVIVGQLGGPATFGNTVLGADGGTGNGQAFIAKLDVQGNLLWAKAATGATSLFEAVLMDPNGNILVAGDDYGDAPTFAFDGVTQPGQAAGVLFSLDPSGGVRWSASAPATIAIDFGSLALSGSNVVVAGALNGDAAFGGDDGGLPVSGCTAPGCVFLATYGADGTPHWAEKAPSTPQRGNEAGNPREVWVAASPSAIWLAISGYFESGMMNPDANQLVVNAYDTTGALTWNKSFPDSTGSPTISGLAVDGTGNLFVGGAFAQGLQLGSGIFPSGQYVAKLSASGGVAWAEGDPSSGQLGLHALALGDVLYTFGNGSVGQPPEGMSLAGIDPGDGHVVSADACMASDSLGEEVAVSAAGVFVAGRGGPPAVFGRLSLAQNGIFVAKRKPPTADGG
jgi:hypothetical protein